MHREFDRFRGRFIKHTGDGILATFDGPARAILQDSVRWPLARKCGNSASRYGPPCTPERSNSSKEMCWGSPCMRRPASWRKPEQARFGLRAPSGTLPPGRRSSSSTAATTGSGGSRATGHCSNSRPERNRRPASELRGTFPRWRRRTWTSWRCTCSRPAGRARKREKPALLQHALCRRRQGPVSDASPEGHLGELDRTGSPSRASPASVVEDAAALSVHVADELIGSVTVGLAVANVVCQRPADGLGLLAFAPEIEQRLNLSARRYVSTWADGVYLQTRMEDDAACILVVIGAPSARRQRAGLLKAATRCEWSR